MQRHEICEKSERPAGVKSVLRGAGRGSGRLGDSEGVRAGLLVPALNQQKSKSMHLNLTDSRTLRFSGEQIPWE